MANMASDVTALVPFRCPSHGKSRLREEVPDDVCDEITEAMFQDVIMALSSSTVGRIVVLIHGPCGRSAVASVGADQLIEPPDVGELNAALKWAIGQIQAPRLLIVPSDLPCVRARDIDRVLEQRELLVIAPTEDGGTGALALQPPELVPPSFGSHSALLHVMAARRSELSHAIVQSQGLMIDVDRMDDLSRALAIGVGAATAQAVSRFLKTSDQMSFVQRDREGAATP